VRTYLKTYILKTHFASVVVHLSKTVAVSIISANPPAFLPVLLVRTLQDQWFVEVTIPIHSMSMQGTLTPLMKDVNPQTILCYVENI